MENKKCVKKLASGHPVKRVSMSRQENYHQSYSRTKRKQLVLKKEANDKSQLRLSDCFTDVVEKVYKIIESNPEINKNSVPGFEIAPLLQSLMSNAIENASKSRWKKRYFDSVSIFSVAIYCLIGPVSYEVLRANLQCLPSASTVTRKISKYPILIKEGEFRYDELVQHLKESGGPKVVNIQQDETRIIEKIEYDPKTNRFVGFCLPIDEDGVPNGDFFIIEKYEELEKVTKSQEVCRYIHIINAQPVNESSPFVLLAFGSNSKYNYEDVMKRWKKIQDDLHDREVRVLTKGADGAGPFLKAMVKSTGLFEKADEIISKEIEEVPRLWSSWYIMPALISSPPVQDNTHVCAKMRNRINKPSIIMPMGNYTASSGHLETARTIYSKDEHNLRQKDLDRKDRQNYEGVVRMVGDGVFACLNEMKSQYRTNATIVYLKVMKYVKDSFLDKKLSPGERIEAIWTAVFFLRYWKAWLIDKGYSIKDNFITQNAYCCIELNAHALINLVYFVNKGLIPNDCLRVWLMGSQTCESLFRLMRSMTPIFSCVVNFSLLGILHRLKRLEILIKAEIEGGIEIPFLKKAILLVNQESPSTLKPPSTSEIFNIVMKAKQNALNLCEEVKMEVVDLDISFEVDIVDAVNNTEEDEIEEDLDEVSTYTNEEMALINKDIDTINQQNIDDQSERKKKHESKKKKTNEPKKKKTNEPKKKKKKENPVLLRKCASSTVSKYVCVTDKQSKKKGERFYPLGNQFMKYGEKYIRKSSAIWILTESGKLSNDRLLRVREVQANHLHSNSRQLHSKAEVIHIGDLCSFKSDCPTKYLLGRITQFTYLNAPTEKKRQFSGNYVDLKKPIANIGVMAEWFEVKKENDWSPATEVVLERIGYHPISSYINSISPDALKSDNNNEDFYVKTSVIRDIERKLKV